jgi:hypothetical protein
VRKERRQEHEEIRGYCNRKSNFTQGWLIVISLFMPVILFVTIVASVGLGVLAAYAVVFGILAAFGRTTKPKPPRQRLVLVPTQNPASGD